MKTCSFRRAQPRSNTESLFCGIDEPQATHAFVSCGDVLCSRCLPLHTFEKVNFGQLLILRRNQCISLSMDIRHISIVLR